MQCCTCSNWVHLKCSLLSFSRFRTLGSSHFWSFPPCCVPAFLEIPHLPARDFVLRLLQLVYLHCSIWPIWPPSANAARASHPRLQISCPHSAHFVSSLSVPSPLSHAPDCFSLPHVSSSPPCFPQGSSMECWGSPSQELLHFISSNPVDLICIQKSNLNLSSSFRIPGFSALRSDRTHSWSGIFSTDVTDASGGVIIFVRQGLSFSEHCTSSLSLLDIYCDCTGVNIYLKDCSSLSFLYVYAPPIRSSPTDSRTYSFSLSILSSSRNLIILWDFNCHHPSGTQKVLPTPLGGKLSIGSSPLTSSRGGKM